MRNQLGAAQQQTAQPQRQMIQPQPNRKEEGLRVLQRIFKRNLRKNFDYLQMGSIDYKRCLMLKRQ